MKNYLVLLILLLSSIFCKEHNLKKETQLNNLDEEDILKSDEGIILACRAACGWKKDVDCLIRCIQAAKGTGSGGDLQKKEEGEVLAETTEKNEIEIKGEKEAEIIEKKEDQIIEKKEAQIIEINEVQMVE